jgi:hypothetical protein
MKKVISVLVLGMLVTSCFNSENGEVDVDITTFQGSVKFSNLSEDKLSGKKEITGLVQSMCTKLKYECKNSATFKPAACSFYGGKKSGDTVFVSLRGTAENSYGVPGEITAYGKIIKGKLLDNILVSTY